MPRTVASCPKTPPGCGTSRKVFVERIGRYCTYFKSEKLI
jgi:hypothetical protein